jgi:hypothetical protein
MPKASLRESATYAESVEDREAKENEEGVSAWAKPERTGERDE